MDFVGIEKLSLVDYDEKVACTLFMEGCNFRCPFCHNSQLVNKENNTPIPWEEIKVFLKRRVGVMDAVVITGGEPTLMPDLEEKIKDIKSFGYEVKLDTNGTNPTLIKKLVSEGLIDYIAMDIKSSPNTYNDVAGLSVNMAKIKETVGFLLENHIDYEFRTTLIDEFHNLETIKELGEFIKGAKKYRLQKFTDSDTCIQRGLHPVSKENALQMKDVLLTYINDVELRSY
ncbi:MAG: anaerobic ribonucleoside-triphosphate reductase activating protein [Bacilli bacterium]|nr:anaerobic ribonucleoside-triphosphate reductase activating protein [Bacilli bacterium]